MYVYCSYRCTHRWLAAHRGLTRASLSPVESLLGLLLARVNVIPARCRLLLARRCRGTRRGIALSFLLALALCILRAGITRPSLFHAFLRHFATPGPSLRPSCASSCPSEPPATLQTLNPQPQALSPKL